MAVWAEVEGKPPTGADPESIRRLAVLRSGPLLPSDDRARRQRALDLGVIRFVSALARLCHDFLRWDRFSVRSMRARAIFEWDRAAGTKGVSWRLGAAGVANYVHVIGGADGPLIEVVRSARKACERLSPRGGPGLSYAVRDGRFDVVVAAGPGWIPGRRRGRARFRLSAPKWA